MRDIGDAASLIDIGDTAVGSEPAKASPAAGNRVAWIVAAALSVIAAVLGFGYYRVTRPVGLKPLVRLDVDLGPDVSLSSVAGVNAIISPDGTRLVYVSQNRLFTRRLDQPNATELGGTGGANAPFFSPDGQWVAFFAQGKLKKTSVTPEGRLIAGQRRLEACRQLGWTEIPVTVVDLLQAARGEAHENFIRKNLLPSEIVALKRAIEPLERREARERQGHRGDLCHPATAAEGQGAARDKIARYLGVGRTTVERAEAVVAAAEEEPEEYGHLVQQMDRSGKVAGAYRRLTVLKQAKELDGAPPELPTGPFQVIVADPPWRYESGDDLPYPTMGIEEIKAMPVKGMAADDSTLWLWTTNAHLRVAFDVVDAWGFEYKTLLTWVKDRMGTGEWLRGQTEHCMLAVRGKPVFLNGSHTTVFEAVRREHSRKPEEFYVLVEATCPGSKLELFSRQERKGWQVFGTQTDRFLARFIRTERRRVNA